MSLKNHQTAFPFEKSYVSRHTHFRWDFYQHVDVIRAHFCFYYFYSFPFTELSQNPSYLFSIFSVEQFAPIFRRKHNVVFAIPFCMR